VLGLRLHDDHAMRRLVVGIDGSQPGANALRWACALAGRFDAEVIVAIAGPEDTQAIAVRDDWSGPAAEAGVRSRVVPLRWEPGPALIDCVETHDADLLVVGHRAHGRLFGLDSVAMYVAHLANRPFALVPSGATTMVPERLVIGLNGSDASQGAAAWAAPMARSLNAKMIGVYAQWPMPELLATIPPAMRDRARAQLEQWVAPLRAFGTVELRVCEARDPVEGLLSCAESARAAAVVIGTRRLGGLRPMRMGGVTMHLLHRSTVPVVVIPYSA
jgi:nucleotide-binding universal stress UspA family protein